MITQVEYSESKSKFIITTGGYSCIASFGNINDVTIIEHYPGSLQIKHRFRGSLSMTAMTIRSTTILHKGNILIAINNRNQVAISNKIMCQTSKVSETLLIIASTLIFKYPELKLTIEKYVFPLIAESK